MHIVVGLKDRMESHSQQDFSANIMLEERQKQLKPYC